MSVARRVRDLDAKDLVWACCAIVIIGEDSVIISASPKMEAMFGYLHGELVGLNLGTLMEPGTGKLHEDNVRRFVASPNLLPVPMTVRESVPAIKKNGDRIEVAVSITAGCDPDTNAKMAIGVVSQVLSGTESSIMRTLTNADP